MKTEQLTALPLLLQFYHFFSADSGGKFALLANKRSADYEEANSV